MDIEQARFNMVEQQIRPWDVLDPEVLALLAVVKREDFVPEACRALAFVDMEVPLPEGQCMLAPKVEARLLQEARIVGQLEHQGIVPLHDVARSAEGHLFSVMRRIKGRTLAAAVREAGSLEARLRLLPHVLAACNAVAYAHSRGVVHRDLKPENVMVDRFGETLVIDWGLARVRGAVELVDLAPETSGALRLLDDSATLSDGQSRLGTPAYMSPEQLSGVRALMDERSDVWGLGGILFEVLTAQPPRDSGAPEADPPKVRALVPQLPVDLAAICDKALEASRERRYASAEALAQDLDAWLHGDRVRAHEYRPMELLGRFVKQNRVAVTIGAAALVALLVVGVVAGLRVRAERNQTREFALLLSGDVLDRVRADVHDQLGTRLTERVSTWLRASPVEDDAVNAFQNKLSRCVVIYLSGNRVEVKTCLKAANRSKFQRHKVEKQCTVGLGGEADEFAFRLWGGRVVDILQIRRLTAESRPVINYLAIDLA